VKALLVRLGLAALARPLLGGLGAVLVFHRLGPRDPALFFEANHRNIIPAALFEQLLDTLAADGVAVVSLDEALDRLAQPRPGRFCCLTFDDGYRDNHDILLPILQARRVPATIYIAPGLVDGTAPLWWYALAQAIARELAGERFPRPLTHDLLATIVEGLHARVTRVVISDLQESTFFANLILEKDGEVISIDARPSDSIAVALRCNAPLFVAEKLLTEGAPQEEPSEEEKREQLRKFLENLDPEDFGKYNP